jgi:hypothetical protein
MLCYIILSDKLRNNERLIYLTINLYTHPDSSIYNINIPHYINCYFLINWKIPNIYNIHI